MDPETLAAVLSVSLDDGEGYAQALQQFTKMINQARTTGLPEQYKDFTPIFINETVPMILDHVLQILSATGQNAIQISDFMKETIQLIVLNIPKKNYKLIPCLSKIFDPTQQFYTYNGRTETSPYSSYLTTFAQTFTQKFGPLFLTTALSNPDLTIDDAVNILDVLKKVTKLLGIDAVFKSKDKLSTNFVTSVNHHISDKEPRKLPHKQIVSMFESIFDCFTDDKLIECCSGVMNLFLKTDIADVKLSGFRLCNILFTKGMPLAKATSDESSLLLIEVLKHVESLEALQCIKPVFMQLSRSKPLNDSLLQQFYAVVTHQHASILPQAINIFADVILNQKGADPSSIFGLGHLPSELLGRLLEGPDYAETASLILWSDAENNPNVIDTLIKAASKVDLSSLLDLINQSSSSKDMINKCISLTETILKKSKAAYDPSTLINNCIENDEINPKSLKSLVSIVSQTKSVFTADQIDKIFNLIDDATTCSFFKMLLPERYPCLASPDSCPVLVKIVSNSGLERFDILEHCYLDVAYSEAQPQVIAAITEAANNKLWEMAMSDCERSRELLLTVREFRELPTKLNQLTQKCIQCFNSTPKEALILARQCIEKSTEFCDLENLGFVPHKFTDEEDKLQLTIRIKSDKYTLSVTNEDTSLSIKPKISRLFMDNAPTTSLVLYYDRSCLKPCNINTLDLSKEIEVRQQIEFEPPAVFSPTLHPIHLLTAQYTQLFALLQEKETSLYAFNLLDIMPTPKDYHINQINPEHEYQFLYDLQYLAKHKEESSQYLQDIEQLFLDSFDILLPESKYILSGLLTQKSKLLIPVLYKLVLLQNNQIFEKIAKRIISLIQDLKDVTLDEETISKFLFDKRRPFVERMLQTELIQSQEFETIFNVFKSYSNNQDEQIKHVFVLNALNLPSDLYEEITDILTPLFDSLNQDVIQCLSKLCSEWQEFPVSRFADKLLEGFIKCERIDAQLADSPFLLIKTMLERDSDFRSKTLEIITEQIEKCKSNQWGYTPSDEKKSETTGRCGLTNLGATCYCNSVLQQLFSIEPFRNFIISSSFEGDSGLTALHKVFTQLYYSNQKAIDMHEFAKNWTDWDGQPINPREQQDAHEFLMYILTKLDGTPGQKLFEGKLSTNMESTGEESFKQVSEESFTILPLEISGQSDFNDSLKLFSAPEIITDYRADNIDHPITVQRYTTIKTLPNYLIIQLKRFEYTIETGMKTKIDSRYHFPRVAEINGEKFDLKGVVIHQGDAEAGHYFSYTKKPDNFIPKQSENASHEDMDWICLNDTSCTLSKETNVLETGSGALEFGTSAYLLFYQKQNFEEQHVDIIPDQPLLDQIHEENRKLLSDRIYYSREFTDFICSLSEIQDCTNVIFNYYYYVSSHSSDVQNFTKITDLVIDLIENKGQLEPFYTILSDNTENILDIMESASPEEIRQGFNKVLKLVFTLLPPENDLLCILISEIPEWSRKILEQWRKSFDYFMIFESIAQISQDHIDVLLSYDLPSIFTHFVINEVPQYAQNKQNNVPLDRFKKVSDLSHLINTLILITPPEECLTPEFLKWCICSEKNVDSLINLFTAAQLNHQQIKKLINDCKFPPSEDLVLALASKLDFIIPEQWLSQGKEAEGRLARALSRAENPSHLAKKQPALIARILFSTSSEARQDAIESIIKRPDDEQFESLAPLCVYVPQLSKAVYSQGGLQSALPFDSYPAYPLLSYLLQILPANITKAHKFCPIFAKAIHDTGTVGGLYDSHLPLLIQLYCNSARHEESPPECITPAALQAIRQCVDKFPENMAGRDDTIRSFFLLLLRALTKTKLSADDIFGDGIKVYTLCLFTNKLPLSSKACLQLTEEATKRYATSAKLFKSIATEMSKQQQIFPTFYEAISFFKDDVMISNQNYILSHPESIKLILQGVSSLTGHEKYFTKAIKFVHSIATKSTHQLAKIIGENPMMVRPFFQLINDKNVDNEAKCFIFEIITSTFEFCKTHLQQIYGDTIVTQNLPSAMYGDEYCSALLSLLLKLWIDDSPPEFIQKRMAQEVAALFRKANAITELTSTITTINDVFSYVPYEKMQFLFQQLDIEHCIFIPWQFKPEPKMQLKGLLELTLAIISGTHDTEQISLLKAAAEKFASESQFHHELLEEIQKN